MRVVITILFLLSCQLYGEAFTSEISRQQRPRTFSSHTYSDRLIVRHATDIVLERIEENLDLLQTAALTKAEDGDKEELAESLHLLASVILEEREHEQDVIKERRKVIDFLTIYFR